MIFVGLASVLLGDEFVPRNTIHCRQHAFIAQATGAQLGVHHLLAFDDKAVDFGVGNHGDECSISKRR